MIIVVSFVILLGWIVGVHAPWWLMAAIYGVGLYTLHKNAGGLESVYIFIGWILFVSVSLVSSVIFGDIGFEGLDFKLLFTGE